MALAIGGVAALSVWDEARESSGALADLAQEQATLAAVTGAGLEIQLETIRRDAWTAAAEAHVGRPAPGPLAEGYVAIRVRDEAEARHTDPEEWGAVPVTVPTADGRRVDLLVPGTRLVPGYTWLAHADTRGLVLPPGATLFRQADGRTVRADSLLAALTAGRTSTVLTRTEASALGLPARMAVAGIALVPVSPLGRWAVVVVASASRERDRQARARWRLVLGVVLAGALVVAFGGAALWSQHKKFDLEQALAMASLREARDAQIERERQAAMMITLAAGVAHEVSTPLSVIVGRAEQVLERCVGDERARRALDAILAQSERIQEVVRGFLRLARGDAPVLDEFDPAVAVRDAVELVSHRFTKAGVHLRMELSTDLPRIRGAPRLLEHALVNLLLNACDACGPGGEVIARAVASGATVSLEVVDDGTGIRPEDAARVVEPFFSTKGTDQGTGLGLAITTEIAKIHRGTLSLVPAHPRGTCATLRLPCLPGGSDATS